MIKQAKLGLALAAALFAAQVQATKFYVRPAGGTYGTEDGTSYANAFDGLVSVAGYAAGDTICASGAFVQETITIQTSGTATAYITFRSDCPGIPIAVYDGQSIVNSLFLVGDNNPIVKYVKIEGFTCHHYQKSCVTIVGKTSDSTYSEYITVKRATLYANGVWNDSAARDISCADRCRRITITNVVMFGIPSEQRGVDGYVNTTDSLGAGHYIARNKSYDHEENCYDFKFHEESAGGEGYTIFERNECYGSIEQGGIDIHVGSKKIKFIGNYIHDNLNAGIKTFPGTGGIVSDLYFISNVIANNAFGGLVDTATDGSDNVYVWNNTFSNNGTSTGGSTWNLVVRSNNYDIRNNSFNNNGRFSGTATPVQVSLLTSTALNGLILNSNHYRIPYGTKFVNCVGTAKTLVEMRASSCNATQYETNGFEGNPQYVGGENPITLDGFVPIPTSPLCRVGVYLAPGLIDIAGIPFRTPRPSIGAYECPQQ